MKHRYRVGDRIKVRGAHQHRGAVQGVDPSNGAYGVFLDDAPTELTVYVHDELDPEAELCPCVWCADRE